MRTSTRSTVVGVFSDRREAEEAIHDLKQHGFHDDQIGIAARDAKHPEGTVTRADDSDAGGAAASGAIGGGVLGGILGALAAGMIPGVGPVIAGGLLAGVLGGAAVGAAAGGLLGALTGMGVPEEDARYYDEEFKGGRTLVTVKADDRYDEARSILHSHGGHDVESRDNPRAGFAATDANVTAQNRPMTDVSSRSTERRPASGDRTLELREEELQVEKERVNAGKVEVEKDIETERRTVDVPTMREEAVIERHAVDRRPADGPISDREEIEIPLREDRVTVDKQAVVYEEVEVGKREVQDTQRVSGEVRREVAHVKNEGDTRIDDDSRRGSSWDDVSPTYRQGWQQKYGTMGGRWEDYEPGYRYGHEMANDPRYSNREWNDVEPEFRSGYSDWARQGGYQSDRSTWDQVRDHARESWESSRSRSRTR